MAEADPISLTQVLLPGVTIRHPHLGPAAKRAPSQQWSTPMEFHAAAKRPGPIRRFRRAGCHPGCRHRAEPVELTDRRNWARDRATAREDHRAGRKRVAAHAAPLARRGNPERSHITRIAVLVCDSAGWPQQGGALNVPDTITLLPLAPYAPELNPMENVWVHLRANKLSRMVGERELQTPLCSRHSLLPSSRGRPGGTKP